MYYLLCKHKVADFTKWKNVFDSHAGVQRKAGLQVLHVLRDVTDPNLIVMLFRADDLDKARAFTTSPKANESAEVSGVIGVPEIILLGE